MRSRDQKTMRMVEVEVEVDEVEMVVGWEVEKSWRMCR